MEVALQDNHAWIQHKDPPAYYEYPFFAFLN